MGRFHRMYECTQIIFSMTLLTAEVIHMKVRPRIHPTRFYLNFALRSWSRWRNHSTSEYDENASSEPPVRKLIHAIAMMPVSLPRLGSGEQRVIAGSSYFTLRIEPAMPSPRRTLALAPGDAVGAGQTLISLITCTPTYLMTHFLYYNAQFINGCALSDNEGR